ncbi:hypothetical protein [Microbacterium sp. NPDC055357]
MAPDERAPQDADARERALAAKRAYNAAHKEQRRRWDAANREKLNAQQAARMRRKRAAEAKHQADLERGRRYREDNRDRERERLRRFREEHPDRVREYQARYKQRHPERVALQGREATMRYRDAGGEAFRERERRAAARRLAANPNMHRDYYQRNLEHQRERSRNAARLRSRLKALGLPPRHVRRTYASDKRANDRAADEFFSRTTATNPDLAARLTAESPEQAAGTRWRAWRNLKERPDEPTPRKLLEQFHRMSAAHRLRAHMDDELQAAIAQVEAVRGAQIREEVRLDAIARNGRRGPPIDIPTETARRVRLAAAGVIHRHHRADARAARQALVDAMSAVQRAEWWHTATRHDITELWHLAHTLGAGNPAERAHLAELLRRGSHQQYGLPIRHIIAGRAPVRPGGPVTRAWADRSSPFPTTAAAPRAIGERSR